MNKIDFNHTPWMIEAQKYLNINEVDNEDLVIQFHKSTTLPAKYWKGATAWCSSFANYILKSCGYLATGDASAISWMNYGVELKSPCYGCLVIYTRDGGNHVHFYTHEDAHFIYGIGGNQDNMVKIKAYDKHRVLGYRWPVK